VLAVVAPRLARLRSTGCGISGPGHRTVPLHTTSHSCSGCSSATQRFTNAVDRSILTFVISPDLQFAQ
jgi:hypothetical protein